MTESLLVSDVVYGPVQSRRLGASLGINVLPFGVKVCGFNCNYCQLGWTFDLVDPAVLAKYRWPSAEEIAAGVSKRLKELAGTKLDCMTFSGNGEPTLHPDFDGVVTEVLALRDREAPGLRVDILTNGARLDDPRVVGGLNLLDERYVKLDAGTDERLLEMNSPTIEISVWDLIQGMKRLKDVVIQAMFTTGRRDNSSDADVERWIQAVAQVNPKRVDLYSISRVPADAKLAAVPRGRLDEIARRLTAATGIPASAY